MPNAILPRSLVRPLIWSSCSSWSGLLTVMAEQVERLRYRQIRDYADFLQYGADSFAYFAILRFAAQQLHAAVRMLDQPVNRLYGRRLARSVRPEQRNHAAFLYIKRLAVQGILPFIRLGNMT